MTNENLEFKLGGHLQSFEEQGRHKFIVVLSKKDDEQSNSLNLNVVPNEKYILTLFAAMDYGSIIHSQIGRAFNVNLINILGGGYYQLSKEWNISLYGDSTDFHSVPDEVASIFTQLIKDKIETEMPNKTLNITPKIDEYGRTFKMRGYLVQRWSELGYDTEERNKQ